MISVNGHLANYNKRVINCEIPLIVGEMIGILKLKGIEVCYNKLFMKLGRPIILHTEKD